MTTEERLDRANNWIRTVEARLRASAGINRALRPEEMLIELDRILVEAGAYRNVLKIVSEASLSLPIPPWEQGAG